MQSAYKKKFALGWCDCGVCVDRGGALCLRHPMTRTMPAAPDDSTIVVVDPLPLRTVGLVSVLDRLSGGQRFRLTSMTPDEAERFLKSDSHCSMIIYNVGGDSLGDHRHARRIKSLRAHAGHTPLVVFSDSDSREEVVSAYTFGARGFLYAGTHPQLALQALSFIFKGGSYFPAVGEARHRRSGRAAATTEGVYPLEWNVHTLDADEHRSATPASELTERQKAVLELLGHGDSNKAIARRLGIREGTVKVHVRQIMRKMGAVNRTQVAIVANAGEAAENARGPKDK
jgi:DNA-binding NarL/FixJ family response regulator